MRLSSYSSQIRASATIRVYPRDCDDVQTHSRGIFLLYAVIYSIHDHAMSSDTLSTMFPMYYIYSQHLQERSRRRAKNSTRIVHTGRSI